VDAPVPKRKKLLSPKAKGVAATLAVAALERLSDPEVRARVADQSRQLAQQVKEWRAQRSDGPPGTKRSRRLRKLDDRARQLRASMGELAARRPDRIEALAAPTQLLDQVDAAIAAVDHLPSDKQRAAVDRIGGELDHLEQVVLEAALPSTGPGSP
jgi:hypothetical protein